jgi:hypothetical protein
MPARTTSDPRGGIVPPAAPRNVQRGKKRSDSGWYLPWWSLIVMIIIVGASALGFVYFIASFEQPQIPGNQTPSVREITSQPTLSQDFASGGQALPSYPTNPTSIPQALPSPTVALPTPAPSPSLPPGEFIVGTRIQVVGVGSDGLNVRSAPGLDGAVNFQAYDDEIFVIVDGPQNVDGREWWKLEDPEDSFRGGWAVRNFLTIAQE